MQINIFILLFIATQYLQAQTPVLPLLDSGLMDVEGAYYKDLDRDFDKFTGTWVSNVNGTTFTLILQKKEMAYKAPIYRDVLIGGYSYKVGENLLIDTTGQLSSPHADFYDYYIFSISIIKSFAPPKCNDCAENEKRIHMYFNDPNFSDVPGLEGSLILRIVTENGTPKLQAKLVMDSYPFQEVGQPAPPDSFTVPFGTYMMSKVD